MAYAGSNDEFHGNYFAVCMKLFETGCFVFRYCIFGMRLHVQRIGCECVDVRCRAATRGAARHRSRCEWFLRATTARS